MNEIETTIDRGAEWRKSVELMQGLFPKWQTSNEQLQSWKERFGMLNPDWFREALHLTYHTYNSDSPKPKWVVECFRQVKAGHQGIPLTESDGATLQRQQDQQEQELHELQVNADREHARNEVATWTQEDATHWATLFAKNYNGMVSERNKLNDIATWSDTFTQFVFVFRKMQTQ
jgi:hypothetical protein